MYISMTELECLTLSIPGQEIIDCSSNNRLVSTVCSFDGGPLENCSFPLELGFGRFGTDEHTVVVTIVDEFGRSQSISFNFSVTPEITGKSHCYNEINAVQIW